MNSSEIVPTIVPASPEDIKEVSARYADFTSFFQIDVTDGKFAPNTTWLPGAGYRLPKNFQYEVHLMVAEPQEVGRIFAEAGADSIIAHIEALHDAENAKRIFAEWKRSGVRSVGLAMLLQTPLEKAEGFLPFVDFVLLMTIPRIGVQGIPYDANAPARVAEFRERYPGTRIAVDGGVSEATIEALARSGARHFGVGSAISRAPDPAAMYRRLQTLAEIAAQ